MSIPAQPEKPRPVPPTHHVSFVAEVRGAIDVTATPGTPVRDYVLNALDGILPPGVVAGDRFDSVTITEVEAY